MHYIGVHTCINGYMHGSLYMYVHCSGSAQDVGGHQPGPKGGWQGEGWTGERLSTV